MKSLASIRPLALAAALFALSPATIAASAQPMTPAQQLVADAVEQFIVEQALHLGGETSVYVSPPPKDFADCAALDVFLPTGRKLGAKTTVAVRCLGQGDTPSYVRADVQVDGVYYVPNQSIDANRMISPDLLEPKSGDLLRLPRGTYTDISQLIGRIAKQRLPSGRPIRISATRGAESILRGQSVKIEARAPGLTITNQGEALSSADVGAPIQVKTAQGKIIQATVLEGGIVAVNP